MHDIFSCFGVDSLTAFLARYDGLLQKLGLQSRIIAKCELNSLEKQVNRARLINNPVIITENQVKKIYKQLFA
jgi:alcohol dehydrogenase class IV